MSMRVLALFVAKFTSSCSLLEATLTSSFFHSPVGCSSSFGVVIKMIHKYGVLIYAHDILCCCTPIIEYNTYAQYKGVRGNIRSP